MLEPEVVFLAMHSDIVISFRLVIVCMPKYVLFIDVVQFQE